MPIQFFKRIPAIASNISDNFARKATTKIGAQLLQLSRPDFRLRFDPTKPQAMFNQGGFKERIPFANIPEITTGCVTNYQAYSEAPFAIGTCTDLNALREGYGEGNSSELIDKTLYGFLSMGVSLGLVRTEILHESGDRDYEKEHLVLIPVPLESFLFATTTKYREEFEKGLQVPNDMATFNKELDLPTEFTIEDARNLTSVFNWLVTNRSEKAAKALCAFIFNNMPKELVSIYLNGDKRLISAAELFLQDVEKPSARPK